MKRPLFPPTLLVILSLLLAACGSGSATPAGPGQAESANPTSQPVATVATDAPAATGGGTVTLIIPEEPANLNYFINDAAIVRQVAEATSMTGLTTVNEKGEFVPVLAAELPTADNGGLSADLLTVTWKLKPDLKWSDGQPLTSDDVKFTWEAVSNPDSGALSGTGGMDLITSIDTPDPTTAVVTYSTPYPGYLSQFAYGILPRHATGAPAEMSAWDWNRKPVAAGPFILSDWKSGETITLERNPNYFESGKPYLDKLIFRVIPEAAAQTAAMLNGEAQVHLWPGEDQADYDTLLKGIAHQELVPGIWNMSIDFNLSKPFDKDPGPTPPHPILGDIRVRQAIAYAIDYETLVRDVMRGAVKPATNPFAYGWYECDLPRLFDYNVDAAKQLLTEAGWVEGPDGIRVAQGAQYAEDGTRLSLELQGYTNFEPLDRTEQFIVENLKAVGIEARIQNYDFSIIFGSFEDGSPRMIGDFDMLIFDRGFTIEPQGEVESAWVSSQIPSAQNPTGGNVWRFQSADADAAVKAAGSTFDLAKRKEAYCNLAQSIMTQIPQISLYVFQDGYGFSDKMSGQVVSTWGSMSWGAQNWKIAP
jgi:peptide/nickel transport system substrate-binding protein